MQNPQQRSILVLFAALMLLAWAFLLPGQKPALPQAPPPAVPPAVPPELVTRLAETRLEIAKAKLEQARPDEALALIVSALEVAQNSAEALTLAEKILIETRWHLPILTLQHPQPIDRIDLSEPSSMWVGLAGNVHTMVRWNLEMLRIENVLFPLPDQETRSLVFDTPRSRVVVERAGLLLLCDAQSLKPIREIGVLPDFVTPSSTITFSADGLLFAHPAILSGEVESLVWQVRDAVSGHLIRTEAAAVDAPRPLAAFLDRRSLKVLHADGSSLEIPVSPVAGIIQTPAQKKILLHHAQFSTDGKSALVLIDHGPHRQPEIKVIPETGGGGSLETSELLERFAWNRQPGIWSGLLRDPQHTPLRVDGIQLDWNAAPQAPISSAAPITAVAHGDSRFIVGGEDGTLIIHQLLPRLPEKTPTDSKKTDPKAIREFAKIASALSGLRYDDERREMITVTAEERLQQIDACDFAALASLFPRVDFSILPAFRSAISITSPDSDAMSPLIERLARMQPDSPDAEPSPATMLAKALESSQPSAIEQCLAAAENLPPLLRKLAVSRVAWLEGRKADALAGWPDDFPDLAAIRLREDWDGWEQADFRPALEAFRQFMNEELSSLALPENPSTEQIQAVIERLTDPETFRSVGRWRLAQATLEAALALTAISGEAESALKLALLAGKLGAPTEPRLRAEALAHAALGDFATARDRWVLLLTEHPVKTHQPTDYSEAAYTAFEAADPSQAIEILTTGMHRFPADVDFAMRAAWIALLTGNPDRAYRFLLTGREVGFPPEILEKATALLAISAVQTGATDEALVFHEQLIELNPTWQNPETIEALDWPEDLKSSLRQLTW